MENITLTEEQIVAAEKRAAGQPYPYLVKSLKLLRIENYVVKVKNHETTYSTTNGEQLIIPGDLPEFECAEAFELEEVKAAVKRTQEGTTDYPTFLREIGAAGIHTYVADLTGMKVIYQGPNSEYEYEEVIPEV